MKKEFKAAIIIAVILVATMGILAVILPYLKDDEIQTPKVVRIYVNSTIYDSIFTELTQYKQDLTNQGFNATLITWSDLNILNLKNDLNNSYNSPQSLFGAVLIGEMPYTMYQNGSEIFPSDLFLMDLDGLWVDADPPPPLNDGIYDHHHDGYGDIYPEIFVGRINPERLNNVNHTSEYKDYFKRNHEYRNGSLTRPHSQLVYIDDDWATTQQLVNEWLGDMTAYSNITCISNGTQTTALDFKSRLTHIYEFVHLFVHSFYYQHQFGPGGYGTEGILTYNDILSTNLSALFFNLYACSACRYHEIDNLGTEYLFSGNTLSVVGSTKTGGMTMNSYFYTPLSQGKVIGEALRLWFSNPLHPAWDGQSQGMTLLGDPFLTI